MAPLVVCIFLLENRADINIKNKLGAAPLHSATKSGHRKIVEMLLENKANINARDNNGQTALHHAAANSDQKCLRSLLSDDSLEINVVDNFQHSAIDYVSNINQPHSPSNSSSECRRLLENCNGFRSDVIAKLEQYCNDTENVLFFRSKKLIRMQSITRKRESSVLWSVPEMALPLSPILAITLPELIKRLTSENYSDIPSTYRFLLSYHRFLTSRQLLYYLCARFFQSKLPPEVNDASFDEINTLSLLKHFLHKRNSTNGKIQSRIKNFLRLWLQCHVREFEPETYGNQEKNIFLEEFYQFLAEIVKEDPKFDIKPELGLALKARKKEKEEQEQIEQEMANLRQQNPERNEWAAKNSIGNANGEENSTDFFSSFVGQKSREFPSFPAFPLNKGKKSKGSGSSNSWAMEIAEQLTLIEHRFLRKIEFSQLYYCSWTKSDKAIKAPDVVALIDRTNLVSGLALCAILTAKKTSAMMKLFIDIAMFCMRPLKNLSTMIAIVSAFDDPNIFRLKKIMGNLPREHQNRLDVLRKISSYKNGMKLLRDYQKKCVPPFVLHFGMTIKDMFRVEQAPDYWTSAEFKKMEKENQQLTRLTQSFSRKNTSSTTAKNNAHTPITTDTTIDGDETNKEDNSQKRYINFRKLHLIYETIRELARSQETRYINIVPKPKLQEMLEWRAHHLQLTSKQAQALSYKLKPRKKKKKHNRT